MDNAFKSKATCPQVPPASKTAASPVGDCFVLTNRIFRIPRRNKNWNLATDISTPTSHVNQNAVLFELGASVTMPTAAD